MDLLAADPLPAKCTGPSPQGSTFQDDNHRVAAKNLAVNGLVLKSAPGRDLAGRIEARCLASFQPFVSASFSAAHFSHPFP